MGKCNKFTGCFLRRIFSILHSMATFFIRNRFSLQNKAYVLSGDIFEGSISKGDIAILPKGDSQIELEIQKIEMVDKANRETEIGLLFALQDQVHIENLELEGKKIHIYNPTRAEGPLPD